MTHIPQNRQLRLFLSYFQEVWLGKVSYTISRHSRVTVDGSLVTNLEGSIHKWPILLKIENLGHLWAISWILNISSAAVRPKISLFKKIIYLERIFWTPCINLKYFSHIYRLMTIRNACYLKWQGFRHPSPCNKCQRSSSIEVASVSL